MQVDDIDQNGKLSLSLVGDDEPTAAAATAAVDASGRAATGERIASDRDRGRPSRGERRDARSRCGASGRETASFEAFWDEQAREEFGDLGPAEEPRPGPRGGDRGGASARRPRRRRRRRRSRGGGRGARRPRRVRVVSAIERTRLASGPARRHRSAARAALGDARRVGRQRRA